MIKLYDANNDIEILKLRTKAKDKCHQFNLLPPSDSRRQEKIIKDLIGRIGNGFVFTAPFWCDYGSNIEIGDNFYCNHNLIILDGEKVKIGNNVFIGPNCCISTASHPLDKELRGQGLEYACPITIGNNVWIGASVVILPGVTIGDNSVIGAGSVVNKDIESNCVAVGSPCRFIRKITASDKDRYSV